MASLTAAQGTALITTNTTSAQLYFTGCEL
jgi:hypothetical protein